MPSFEFKTRVIDVIEDEAIISSIQTHVSRWMAEPDGDTRRNNVLVLEVRKVGPVDIIRGIKPTQTDTNAGERVAVTYKQADDDSTSRIINVILSWEINAVGSLYLRVERPDAGEQSFMLDRDRLGHLAFETT
jgi:hypothetical protein